MKKQKIRQIYVKTAKIKRFPQLGYAMVVTTLAFFVTSGLVFAQVIWQGPTASPPQNNRPGYIWNNSGGPQPGASFNIDGSGTIGTDLNVTGNGTFGASLNVNGTATIVQGLTVYGAPGQITAALTTADQSGFVADDLTFLFSKQDIDLSGFGGPFIRAGIHVLRGLIYGGPRETIFRLKPEGTVIANKFCLNEAETNCVTGNWAAGGLWSQVGGVGPDIYNTDFLLGKVGIGIAAPQSRLHVYDSVDARLRLEANSTPQIEFVRGTEVGYVGPNSSNVFNLSTGINQPLAISTGGAERVRVLSTGDVGIGTAAPTTKLHVEGGDIYLHGKYSQLGKAPDTVNTVNLRVNASFSWPGEGLAVVGGMAQTWPNYSGNADLVAGTFGQVAEADVPVPDPDLQLEGFLGAYNSGKAIYAGVFGRASKRTNISTVLSGSTGDLNFADDLAGTTQISHVYAGYFEGDVKVDTNGSETQNNFYVYNLSLGGSDYDGVSFTQFSPNTNYALTGDNDATRLNARDNIQLRVGNVEKVRLTANGNVGFGVTNPLARITIPGGQRLSLDDNYPHRSLYVDETGGREALIITNHSAALDPTIRFRDDFNNSDKVVINVLTGSLAFVGELNVGVSPGSSGSSGQCLISGGDNQPPFWGACTAGGGYWSPGTTYPNDIHNINTGNVGIGVISTDPIDSRLYVKGGRVGTFSRGDTVGVYASNNQSRNRVPSNILLDTAPEYAAYFDGPIGGGVYSFNGLASYDQVVILASDGAEAGRADQLQIRDLIDPNRKMWLGIGYDALPDYRTYGEIGVVYEGPYHAPLVLSKSEYASVGIGTIPFPQELASTTQAKLNVNRGVYPRSANFEGQMHLQGKLLVQDDVGAGGRPDQIAITGAADPYRAIFMGISSGNDIYGEIGVVREGAPTGNAHLPLVLSKSEYASVGIGTFPPTSPYSTNAKLTVDRGQGGPFTHSAKFVGGVYIGSNDAVVTTQAPPPYVALLAEGAIINNIGTNGTSYFNGGNVVITNGNVGIGTTNPQAKLNIAVPIVASPLDVDAIRIDANQLGVAVADNSSLSWYTNKAPPLYKVGSISVESEAGGYGMSFSTWTGGAVSKNLYINQAGNVGIGTTLPVANLQVNAAGSAVILVSAGSTGAAQIEFQRGSGSLDYIGPRADGQFDITQSLGAPIDIATTQSQPIVFKTNDGGGGGERLRITGTGNVGIGTSAPADKLHIASGNGRVDAGFGWLTGSDVRLKKNITTLSDALELTLALRGVRFDLKDDPASEPGAGKFIGFIAQELEKVFPEFVITDEHGYKSVAYDKLTAVLVQAVKELAQQVSGQRQQITELRDQLKVLEGRLQKLEQQQ